MNLIKKSIVKRMGSWWDKFICAKCGEVAKFCECKGGAQGC